MGQLLTQDSRACTVSGPATTLNDRPKSAYTEVFRVDTMKLTGTVLRCTTRKVNSSGKETYVTNLLVLDPENSGGTNYAVEVWDDKPHQVAPMSEIALKVIGVVN